MWVRYSLLTPLLAYLLTDWLHGAESLLRSQPVLNYSINSPHFMEPEYSLPISQVPATCLYPEPARSNSYPTSYLLKFHLSVILPSTPGSSKWSPSLTKTLYMPLLSPISAICPSHLILLESSTRIRVGEQYRSLSSLLCSFLHSPLPRPS